MFVDYLALIAESAPKIGPTFYHLIRAGCTCEGHEHSEDSWFPDFCNKCKCVCNQDKNR